MLTRETIRTRALTLVSKLALAVMVVGAVQTISSPAQADEPKKIGYVDLQRALNSVEDGKQAKAKLEKDFEAKQQKLKQKEAEVKELQESLQSGSEMMTEEAQRKKATELQQEMAALQELYMELQRDLAEKEGEATQRIFGKMEKIIEKIADEKDYDLILEKTESSVLFAEDSMDLTDELIKRYNGK